MILQGFNCLLTYPCIVLRVKSWVLSLIFIFRITCCIYPPNFSCRDLFGVIVNLLMHLGCLMYAKTLVFMFDITNIQGSICHKVYLLPLLTIIFKPVAVGLW